MAALRSHRQHMHPRQNIDATEHQFGALSLSEQSADPARQDVTRTSDSKWSGRTFRGSFDEDFEDGEFGCFVGAERVVGSGG